jgi:hypothetical protein
MLAETENRLRNWVLIVCSIVTVVFVGIFSTGSSYGSLEQEVDYNTEHRRDTNMHIPFQEKIKVFVTREEHNDMKKQLDRIEDKLDNLR